MHKIKMLAAAATLSLAATGAQADNWVLDAENSNLSFASIKSELFGENHTFSDISGSVSEDGAVELSIGLASVETFIDIRNERMIEHVFNNIPNAEVTAELDMEEVNGLAVGESTNIETFGTLELLGTEVPVDAAFFVMRLSEDQVMVTTNGMIFVSTEDAGINEGIDTLQELASLDSITRVSPITMRLMFNREAITN
ncbi:MAG: YceI family protein [Pseudomonadota bacterium]